MSIHNLSLRPLHNEEHFKFHTDVDGLITEATPEVLKIPLLYPPYKALLSNELEAMDKISKSSTTEKIDAADIARDNVIQGIIKMDNAMLHHFDPAINEAAARVKIVLDNFAGITHYSYDKESAAIIKLLELLKGSLAADVAAIGITSWVTELEAKNKEFDALFTSRYDEQAAKTALQMKDVRIEIDDAYNKIIERINALIVIEGEAAYVDFVTKLNLRIDHYASLLALRKGRNKAAAKAATTTPEA